MPKWIKNNRPLALNVWDNIKTIIETNKCQKEYYSLTLLDAIYTCNYINFDGIELYPALQILEKDFKETKAMALSHSYIMNMAKCKVTAKFWDKLFAENEVLLSNKRLTYG